MQLNIHLIQKELLNWFGENKRSLPWRKDRTPYKIWLSEVILQQTRVNQGLPYYLRFIEKYPTVNALAEASEQEVLRLWQGLGYYSRARNLHHTAKTVAEKYNGIFPDTIEEIKKLKGIGNYTAAAILSLAYNKPHAVLDGNVYRVLSRLHALDLPINAPSAEKVYQQLADELLDKSNPGEFNEAVMEFGATVCTPVSPSCVFCPLQKECQAFTLGKVNELPIKLKTNKITEREIHYLFIRNEEGVYLKKRAGGDIWQGLYDMPEKQNGQMAAEAVIAYGNNPQNGLQLIHKHKHQLSHQTLYISFYEAEPEALLGLNKIDTIFVPFEKLDEYPLPKPLELFLKGYLENPKLY